MNALELSSEDVYHPTISNLQPGQVEWPSALNDLIDDSGNSSNLKTKTDEVQTTQLHLSPKQNKAKRTADQDDAFSFVPPRSTNSTRRNKKAKLIGLLSNMQGGRKKKRASLKNL
eukprot:TRINITY_DN18216_c0_g1_i1.p1 TRINITY_DN18216_c0_g1~~TRINITY_DN18216_c0_g1_i1.p1  ORF type:complete len:115 (+),score=18.45 TRINITY_DN18216_c0_g1_i1:239-583(+)